MSSDEIELAAENQEPEKDLDAVQEEKTEEHDECGEGAQCTETGRAADETEQEIKPEINTEQETEQPDSKTETVELLNALNEKVDSLQTLFSEKIANSEADDKVITNLHSELQKYKNDMYSQIIKPVLMDIIDIHDGMFDSLNKPDDSADEANPSRDALKAYAEQTEYVLNRYGVSTFKSDTGSAFNPLRQRIVRKANTDNQSLNGKVSESLNFGYEYKEQAISKEKIIVFSFVKDNKEVL